MPRTIGYGICGPNERYLEQTLKEFERLCDDVIICTNNATDNEKALIKKYDFRTKEDNREWGVNQWKIKEDLVKKEVKAIKPEMLICLDMDETFGGSFDKGSISGLFTNPFEAFYFRFATLWDDGLQNRPFWNIRAWKWKEEFGCNFKQTPLHCGLYPEWAWSRAYYSPYIVKHYGLKDKESRLKKAERYKKYDPKAKFCSQEYYDSLSKEADIINFDEDLFQKETENFVKEIKQKYYFRPMQTPDQFVYIKTKKGETALVPKAKLSDYTKQGCQYVGEYDAVEKEVTSVIESVAPYTAPEIEKIKVEANSEAPAEEFICNQCGHRADSYRALRMHRFGAHLLPARHENSGTNGGTGVHI